MLTWFVLNTRLKIEKMINLLQEHTVQLYQLDKKSYVREKIHAKELLKVNRFDLYAKMAYIHYRESNPDYALGIYEAHIKAFNPDLKEPGRTDKNCLEDFVTAFDQLIDYFKNNEFNPEISLIPLSENGDILDGSHRIAALAYYNKEVEVVRFNEVKVVWNFNYDYFLRKGLSRHWADAIVYESNKFSTDFHVACLWSSLGNLDKRAKAREIIHNHFDVFYIKEMRMNLEALTKFMYEIYDHQDWVGDENNNFAGARNKAMMCYGNNRIVQFVIFRANDLNEVLEVKKQIRDFYQLDKHALHITDNTEETQEIFDLIFTEKSKMFNSSNDLWRDKLQEKKFLFKNVYWLGLKVRIAKFLKTIGLYR